MITEKILKELGFERHPALRSTEFWDLWLSDNTYNEKEHKFNRVLYIKRASRIRFELPDKIKK